jgi:hypothetical protein
MGLREEGKGYWRKFGNEDSRYLPCNKYISRNQTKEEKWTGHVGRLGGEGKRNV